jgi:hypothetical protein
MRGQTISATQGALQEIVFAKPREAIKGISVER